MIRNTFQAESDGINVYINLKVKAAKTGIRLLTAMIVLFILSVIGLLSLIPPEEVASTWPIMLILSVILLIFPLKYLFWNLYGEEEIIVTTKSISYTYNYGFWKTNLATLFFDKLGIGFEVVKTQTDGIEIGQLVLFNYRNTDGFPESIFSTAVLVTLDELEEAEQLISQIFRKQRMEAYKFQPFSSN